MFTTDIWNAPETFFQNTLYILSLTLIFKYIIGKFRRDPRFVKFASTLQGPFDFPLIGNGLEFLTHNKDDVDKIFFGYTQKYGSVYRLWIGNKLLLCLSDLQHVETVLRNPKSLAKPNMFTAFNEFWKDSLFTAPMHIWTKTRKCIQPLFIKSVVKFQIPLINESVKKYVNLMRNEIDEPEFDLDMYMPYLAADSFFHIHFNSDFTIEQNKYFSFHKILNNSAVFGFSSIFIPWYRINLIRRLCFGKTLSSGMAKFREFSSMIKNINHPETEETGDIGNRKIEKLAKSFLPTIRQLEDELKIDGYLTNELALFISAASDTTSHTASFFLLSVAMYPEIQDKLYDELCNVFDVHDDRPVTMDDLGKLPYMNQVIKETQRRHTLVPVILRGVEEDMKIGSMNVPSGTAIMVRIGDIHMNPDLYPNPLEFNPENFSPEAISRRSKYSWLPFSAGTRDCIGRTYAETALRIKLITLLRNFKFFTTTKMEDIKYTFSSVAAKRGGYWVSITSRK